MLDVVPCLVVKKLTVEPGRRISLQRHHSRHERWIVMEGEAAVQCGGESMLLRAGEGVLIPRGCPHRLTNATDKLISVLEIQYGEKLSEDDIERLEDDYGRIQ